MSPGRTPRGRVGFFGACILATCMYNFLIGCGTLDHLSGHPDDAPHLHAPDVVRGWAWVALALCSAVLVMISTRCAHRLDLYRWAIVLLLVMPSVRGISYTIAWILSWSVWGMMTPGPSPWWDEGSPSGWYTCLPWVGEVAVLLTLAVGMGRRGGGNPR